ncbi:MAG: hypothetical protein ABIF11_02555 [Nitrospirota bacterium]
MKVVEDWEKSFPKALLWDYKYPPGKNWALQRLAEFFPVYGHDRKSVELLYAYLDRLHIPHETQEAIKLYYRIWQEETRGK